MSFELSPSDNNYLTSSLLFKQMQNSQPNYLSLNSTNASVVHGQNAPEVILDGSGRAYLKGNLQLDPATPGANIALFNLPSNLSIKQDATFTCPVLGVGGSYSNNAIKLLAGTETVIGAVVTAPGSYTALPTISTIGPGSGATFAVTMKVISLSVVTAQSGGGSYAPGDIVTLTGGTHTVAATGTVTNTLVESATVANAGSGGTDGTATVTGTTGTGTKFQANVTIASGAISTINSISLAGNYTVNPTVLTAEPVTGGGLVGATLNLKMGVEAVTPLVQGAYTVLPTSPIGSTTGGSGTGATFSALWGVEAIAVTAPGAGYDETSQIIISGSGIGGGAATLELSGLNSVVTAVLGNAGTHADIISLDGIVFFVNSY